MDQRPPPEVTIRDPARPQRSVDVLVLGDEEPRSRAAIRPWATALAAVLVLLAGLVSAEDLHEQQRLASAVELRLDPESSGTGSYDAETDSAALELLLPVHNDGPRDVVVLSGGAGGFGLSRPVELRAGSWGILLLEQRLDCSSLPEPPTPVDTLELSVRTAAGREPRRVRVPMPHAWTEHGRDLCQNASLDQGVRMDVLDISSLPDALQVTLELSNGSPREVGLLAVRALDPGLEATLEEPARGPLRLLPRNGTGVARTHVRVTDCAAARAAADDPTRSDEPMLLEVLVEDARRAHALPPLAFGPSLRRELLDRSC